MFHKGEFKAAYRYFEQAVTLHNPQQHTLYSLERDHDSGVANLCRLASTLWMLGYPDQAQACMGEALTMARRLAHAYETVVALDFACNLERYLRRPQAAQAVAAEMGVLTAKHHFANYVAAERIYRGWLLAEQGDTEAAIVLVTQGLDALRQMGTFMFLADYLALLVEVYWRDSQFEQGVALAIETLALVEETGERYWSAELHRLQGELLLAQGTAEHEVVECYWRAIDIARQQDAKSLELRATLSLVRLWRRQAKYNEAHRLLAEIYSWFTEGFETADLQEAKALLEDLHP